MNSPPASRPRTPPPPPPPRPDGPPDPSDATGRRYPRRSTRAPTLTPIQRGRTLASPPPPQPRPCEASGSDAGRRYPLRSTRAVLSERAETLARAPPPPSVPPTSPAAPSRRSPPDAAEGEIRAGSPPPPASTTSTLDERQGPASGNSAGRVKSFKKKQVQKNVYERREESVEEEDEEEVEKTKHKGTACLIEIDNPNLAKPKSVKAKNVNVDRTTDLSRREREELEKQKSILHYKRLQEEGKTDQARKDLAAGTSAGRPSSFKKKQVEKEVFERRDESIEEEDDEEVEKTKHKGTAGLIEIDNPNLVKPKSIKAKDVNVDRTTDLSRREREKLEKQRSILHYKRLQEEGKTDQARKYLGNDATGSKDNDMLIEIQSHELHHTLDTLGVSTEERKEILGTVLNKCMDVYNETVYYHKQRCLTVVKAITDLEAKHAKLCNVLGEEEGFCTEEFQMSASLPTILSSLTISVKKLEVYKKQRLRNLHGMQDKLIDLWDHLAITIAEQKNYRYMMCNSVSSSEEVTEKGALSAALFTKIEEELKRLEDQLMLEVTKKFAVLAGNLRQAHLSGDKNFELKFTLVDVQDQRIDLFLADDILEELILKSKMEIVQRADIVDRAESLFNSREESSSHNEVRVRNLIDRVKDWEAKNERKFIYDKQDLITELLEPERDRHYHLSDAIACSVEEIIAGAEEAQSPTWSDSSEDGSDDSESDDESKDPDFAVSDSEEE